MIPMRKFTVAIFIAGIGAVYAGHHTATLTAAASHGRGQARSSEAIVPFRINVPNAVLVDLKALSKKFTPAIDGFVHETSGIIG
jgi:hypothetical protein